VQRVGCSFEKIPPSFKAVTSDQALVIATWQAELHAKFEKSKKVVLNSWGVVCY
jgi:hypothetical protein